MTLRTLLKQTLPKRIVNYICRKSTRPSASRTESNKWLLSNCGDILGSVLSIGIDNDSDGEGGVYKSYFPKASSYTTSEVSEACKCDLTLDVRKMPQIRDQSFDCIFCSGVLEHVDEFQSAISEITRILKKRCVLLLGLPFRQGIHMRPHDFWRFSEFGIRHLLKDSYEIVCGRPIDTHKGTEFPATYWVKARKI